MQGFGQKEAARRGGCDYAAWLPFASNIQYKTFLSKLYSWRQAWAFQALLTCCEACVSDRLCFCQPTSVTWRCLRHLISTALIFDALIKAVKSGGLSEERVDGFSWLLFLVFLPRDKASTVVREYQVYHRLLRSPPFDVRTRAYRIKHIVDTITTTNKPEVGGPGGRHDNDFADMRKIAILPTSDELASTDRFLRRPAEIQGNEAGSCNLALHTDSQFRLRREDENSDDGDNGVDLSKGFQKIVGMAPKPAIPLANKSRPTRPPLGARSNTSIF